MSADIPEQEPVSAEPTRSQPTEKHDEAAPIVRPIRAELNIPPSVISQYNADQTKSYKLERWKFRVEILTLAAIAVYTSIAYHQWTQMREATKAAKTSADAAQKAADTADATLKSSQKSFQIDQRPYVITDGPPQFVIPPNAAGTPVSANVVFKDIGRTPAINAVWFVDLLPYTATSRPDYLRFLENSYAKLRKRREDTTVKHAAEMSRDIAPTATTFSSEFTRALSTAEMKDLGKGDGNGFILVSVGIVNYTDAFNGSYETEFCYYFVGTDPKVWHMCWSRIDRVNRPEVQPESWKIDTNDRYSKIVQTIISLATGSLILPALVLREFLGVPRETALVPYLNRWAYIGWGSLGVSVLSGLAYSWLSVKWVKRAWGQHTLFSETWLDRLMNCSFGLMLLLFLLGLLSIVWFFFTFHVTDLQQEITNNITNPVGMLTLLSLSRLDTWLTVAIAAAAVAQATFAGFLWWLQRELRQERHRALVAVALEIRIEATGRKAIARVENASSSGVLFRHLILVASAKGRKTEARKVDYRMSIPAYDFREKDITAEISGAARNVDEGDPAWTSGQALTVSFDFWPFYTKIGDQKIKGRRVTYWVEFVNGSMQSATVVDEEERKEE